MPFGVTVLAKNVIFILFTTSLLLSSLRGSIFERRKEAPFLMTPPLPFLAMLLGLKPLPVLRISC